MDVNETEHTKIATMFGCAKDKTALAAHALTKKMRLKKINTIKTLKLYHGVNNENSLQPKNIDCFVSCNPIVEGREL